jgi:hypothetical protein
MVLKWSIFKIVSGDPDLFQKRRLLNNFPIGSYVKTMSADGGHFEPRSGSLNTILEVDHLHHRWHVCYIGLLVSYLCQVSDTGSPEPLVYLKNYKR